VNALRCRPRETGRVRSHAFLRIMRCDGRGRGQVHAGEVANDRSRAGTPRMLISRFEVVTQDAQGQFGFRLSQSPDKEAKPFHGAEPVLRHFPTVLHPHRIGCRSTVHRLPVILTEVTHDHAPRRVGTLGRSAFIAPTTPGNWTHRDPREAPRDENRWRETREKTSSLAKLSTKRLTLPSPSARLASG
jgi:hypothetical protein